MTAHLTEHEVAERFALSVKTVRDWRLTGYGPRFRKFGRAVRYPLAEIEKFEQAATRCSTSDLGPTSGDRAA